MSIFIEGLDLPEKIESDVIEFADGINGKRYARVRHYRFGGLTDLCTDWCEVVSVPPHGDLIDRDKLLEDDPEIHEDWIDSDGYCWNSEWGYTREQIENAPIIIPADKEDDKE